MFFNCSCHGKKRKRPLLKALFWGGLLYGGYTLLKREPTRDLLQVSEDTIQGKDIVGIPGEEATFYIYGLPGKTYGISVTNPSQQASESQGLEDQVADATGYCEWTWMVGTNTGVGEGSIVVSDDQDHTWTFAYRVEDDEA